MAARPPIPVLPFESMNENEQLIDFTALNAVRVAHNYLMGKGGDYDVEQVNVLTGYVNYLLDPKNRALEKKKIGVLFVAVNPPYWQYATEVIAGVKALFLPGHDVEILLFSDIPQDKEDEQALLAACPEEKDLQAARATNPYAVSREYVTHTLKAIRAMEGVKIVPIEPAPWPYPTLMRYHLFLQEEEYLKRFDYLFYLDLDMRLVGVVGDEILGEGLTGAQHPMYAVRKEYVPPYEPNPESAAYIPRPGRVVMQDGQPRFEPLYFAGGFQGGQTPAFMAAMKAMKKMIDADFQKNYIPIWNDESIWNRYLFDHPPAVVLSPSYVYPDSMIGDYYLKIWGRNYTPRIITITKSFTLSKEGGAEAQRMMDTL